MKPQPKRTTSTTTTHTHTQNDQGTKTHSRIWLIRTAKHIILYSLCSSVLCQWSHQTTGNGRSLNEVTAHDCTNDSPQGKSYLASITRQKAQSPDDTPQKNKNKQQQQQQQKTKIQQQLLTSFWSGTLIIQWILLLKIILIKTLFSENFPFNFFCVCVVFVLFWCKQNLRPRTTPPIDTFSLIFRCL